MLQVTDLSKSYGTQLLFDRVNFTINQGERIGLVGRNGHGKTTLFRLFLGQEEQDSGSILIPNGYKIGHLSQHLDFKHPSILREVASALPHNDDGWEETYKAEAILSGLGFNTTSFDQSPLKLSGGYQIRLNLAKLLVSEPHLLLLDEPTNYLDIVSLRWLKQFLRAWPHELILITHERGFMDSVTTHTMAIHRQQVRKMQGATTKLYDQIATEEEIHEKTRANQEQKIKKSEDFIRRFRAKATKASAVQSRIKALDKIEKLERLSEIEDLDFNFNSAAFQGKNILVAEHLTFGYVKETPLIEDLSLVIKPGDRLAVIGKNGKGKTTLLNLLSEQTPPDSGNISKSIHAEIGYFGQTNVQRLTPELTVEEEILAVHPTKNRTAARNICGQMMFSGDLALKKIKHLSGGEKSRVLLGKTIVTPSNLLLLDEPTNHLDMYATEAFMDAIESFHGAVVLVSHSEEMIERIANRLLVFDGGKTFLFEGPYKDFLKKIGWQDEQSNDELPPKEATIAEPQLSKSEKNKEKLKVQKEVSRIERQIIKLEEDIEDGSLKLVELTREGFGPKAKDLTLELAEKRQKLELLYEELEQQSEQLSGLQ